MGTVLDVLIVAAIAALAAWAFLALRKDRKRGCGGGCYGCPMAGKCDKQTEEKRHE